MAHPASHSGEKPGDLGRNAPCPPDRRADSTVPALGGVKVGSKFGLPHCTKPLRHREGVHAHRACLDAGEDAALACPFFGAVVVSA